MESPGLSDPQQPRDDMSQSSSSVANVDRSETPDSNRGPVDDESAADSPKITKPVLGKVQAKKRLMAFASKFTAPLIQKTADKNFSFKSRNINSFQANKKKLSNSTKDSINESNVAKNKICAEVDNLDKTKPDLTVTLKTKSPSKKSKKRAEPKIAAIDEIMREDAREKELLAIQLSEKKAKLQEENDLDELPRNNGRNDRNRNFGRYQQWSGRRSLNFHNDNFRRGNFNQNHGDRKFNDRRRPFNNEHFRDRSRSRERREREDRERREKEDRERKEREDRERKEREDKEKRQSNSFDMDQSKIKGHKHDSKHSNKHRNYNDHKKEKKEEVTDRKIRKPWKNFKEQGGRIRERSLSIEMNEDSNFFANREVKFKTALDYNAQLEHMLMIGTHHVKRTCVTVDGINDDKKQYPPESIRVTKKCNGPNLFYSENPKLSLLFPCQQLFQILPPDRCNIMRKIVDETGESLKEIEYEQGPRKWFKHVYRVRSKEVEHEVKCPEKSKSSVRKSRPPKSRWDSEDEAVAKVGLPSNSSPEVRSVLSDGENEDEAEQQKDNIAKVKSIAKESLEAEEEKEEEEKVGEIRKDEVEDEELEAEKDNKGDEEVEEEDEENEDEKIILLEKVNSTSEFSCSNKVMQDEGGSNKVESDLLVSNEEIQRKDRSIEVISNAIETKTLKLVTDNDNNKLNEKVKIGKKLVSEYEEFLKIVGHDEEEENPIDIDKKSLNDSAMKIVVEQEVINQPITDEYIKENTDKVVKIVSDTEMIDSVVENESLDCSQNIPNITCAKIEKIDETILIDSEISGWENIKGKIKHGKVLKSRKRRERRKKKNKKKVSSSESSDSSSSSSDSEDEKRKRKRKRKRRKKRARDSSSDSSSSDASSDETINLSKKKKRRRKIKKKLRIKNKKKRIRKDSTVSNSSYEFDELTRKRRKRKDSKHRKISKRKRSKSTEKKRVQKITDESQNEKIENDNLEVIIKEEVLQSPHWETEVKKSSVSIEITPEVTQIEESLEDKTVLEPTKKAPSAEKLYEVWDNSSNSQIAQHLDDQQPEKSKLEEPQNEEPISEVANEDTSVVEHEQKPIKDTESVHHSPIDKTNDIIEITTDTVSDNHSDKKGQKDSSRSKKVKKIKKKRRSISTTSTSSDTSSESLDDVSSKKKSREKRKKKSRSKRRSPSQSQLIKKLKKYRAKLSESFDFDALHFPSLTQLEENNETLPIINDWEVDSMDALEKFVTNSSEEKSTVKPDTKIEKGLLYDSKTDTYIAVEKSKTQRENKKKQVNRICSLRIWEDEEEEGEREAKMLLEEKNKIENKLNVPDNLPEVEPVILPTPTVIEEKKDEEKKLDDLPENLVKIAEETSQNIKEEKSLEWVEIIPACDNDAVEIVPEQQVPTIMRWDEPSPVLLKKEEEEELEDDNLMTVNWEEEEIDWENQSSLITGVKSVQSSKNKKESSESSSDSSDSSSSSESSDSDTENVKKSRQHGSSVKSKYVGSKNVSPIVETDAMKTLRMNMFAEFATRESTDDFSQLSAKKIDTNISSFELNPEELPLLTSEDKNKSRESADIPILKFEDTCFASQTRESDTILEKGTFRSSFQEVRLRSYSRSPDRDSKRSLSSRNDKSKTRSSEDRGSTSSYRSSSRGSVKDSTRDRKKIDDKDLKGSSLNADQKKVSSPSDRSLNEKRRSPVSWNRSRSRSRSWSRSRSRTPSKRDDKLSWDRQKRIRRVDDRREKFSRSPDRRGRLQTPSDRERSHRSTEGEKSRERDRSRDRSRERDWNREKINEKPYNPMEMLRSVAHSTDKQRQTNLERPLDTLDTYHKNINLEKDINIPFSSDLDKPRYRSRSRSRSRSQSRSRSREQQSRDIDWDRSRESPDSSRSRTLDTRKSSRLSPRPRGSPLRSSRRSRYSGRSRSRSRSWSRSRSRTRSRSRSRSIQRFRSRSRSSSRSRSRLGLRSSDRGQRSLDRPRRSRSFSPEQRKLNIVSDMGYRRSTSKERIQQIETIIHPPGINSLSREEPQNIPQINDSNNISVPTQQFEYSYYAGNNLTYPPRLETTTITTPTIAATTINPPAGSPKRLSLDDRLELELGIKKSQEPLPPPLPPLPPPPPPHPYHLPKYNPQTMQYPPPTPVMPVLQPRIPTSLHSPYARSPHPTVLQVGNVLQVVPADYTGPVPPVGIRNDITIPPPSTGNNNANRVVRVGNVLQVVPSTTLDWSGPVPPPAPVSSTSSLPMSNVPMAVPVPMPTPVPMPIVSNVPPVSHSIIVPVPPVTHIQPIPPPPPPIAVLPKLEPPKAPPVLQPIYNYEAIMEARRKEKEERKRLREEKRREKERKKLEKMQRRAKRVLGQSSSHTIIELPVEPDTTVEGEVEDASVSILPRHSADDEDIDDQIPPTLGQLDENPPEDEDEEEEYDEGDVEEDDEEEDEEEEPEPEIEDDESRVMNLSDQQLDTGVPSVNETVDEDSTSNVTVVVIAPLPPPPRKGILVPPGLWDERIVNGVLDDDSNTASSTADVTQANIVEQSVENVNEEKSTEVDPEERKLRTLRQRRSRKSVQFADGIKPGEGTSPSGCEGDMPSPPPPTPMSLHDPLHEHIRRSRSRKMRKKAKRAKPLKIKKKVKVKIIKLKKPKITPLTSMMMDDSDDMDDRSPPPPPPGSPPPPHLWPSYLAAYSAILRPVEGTSSPSTIQAPPPPTPLPLLVPPPPLNYTIQPCNKA